MASYGCLHEWAGLLRNKQAASLLEEILDEEKAANDKLTNLARGGSNQEALDQCDEKESENGLSEKRPLNLRRGMRPANLSRKRAESLVQL
jgi:hypothetical protein